MKKIIILTNLIILYTVSILSQQVSSNFSIDDGKIIWQKVFETDLSFEQLSSIIKESGIIQNAEISESKVIGNATSINPDFKGLGYGNMSTPIFISRNFVNCFSLIEFREGRYRVTLKNIVLVQKFDDPLSTEGEKTPIEEYAINRRGEIQNSFTKRPSEILDYTFTKIFTFTDPERDDEW